jgi:uncharacterized protein (DUF362 family)/ferredoxin
MLATQTNMDLVAVTRTFDGIEAATHRIIEQVGGMESVVKGAKIVILKPNLVAGRNADTGSTTSFALMKAVADEVRACGAEPVLCETPGTEFDRDNTYTILGIDTFCKENNIGILRVDPEGGEADWVEVNPDGAKILRHFHKPRILQEARLINLPVLKTHVVSTMTICMKNLMGILPRPDRRHMHSFDIHQSVVDMNLGIQPDLNIVDGSMGQHGEGPVYGDKANLQVLVAGRNSLAVDLECCGLVGVNPHDVPHLHLALQHMGRPFWRSVGEDVGEIMKFNLPPKKKLYNTAFRMMFWLDYPFTLFAERGQHFVTSFYQTGVVGTRPVINEDKCTRCGVCVDTCPLPGIINLQTLKINPATCERCLLCYEACPEKAISVKGYSGAR